MTPEESNWENEGSSCRPEPGEAELASYSPAIRALTDCELVTLRLLAEEFFAAVEVA